MQIIDISDETKLLNALQTYASGYFDSFDTTVEETEKSVSCIVNQDTVLTLGWYKPGSWESRLYINETTIYYPARGTFATMHVFENGILITSNRGYTYPVLICKRNNSDTAIVLLIQQGDVTYVDSVGTGSIRRRYLATIDHGNGNVTEDIDSVVFSSNVTGQVLGYTPFSKHDGITLKDVYIVTDSDFRNKPEPFTYLLNGQTYTGIAGNYFAVKGN